MSIFSIGLSGLRAAQIALNTTSNNVSNVYTPGYNRELTILAENRVGGGSKAVEVQRQHDLFIARQLNSAVSDHSALQSYNTQISQIDNLLGDMDAGLSRMMENFFSAIQDFAGAPADPASRQGVIGTAESLTAQLRSFDSYLHDMQEGINTQITSEVVQINNTVEQIASLNNQISLARAKTGVAPNTLLNQRDHLVAELSKRIDVQVHQQDGAYNITVGNGNPLVSGKQAYQLSVVQSAADPSRTVVGYVDSAGNELELPTSTFKSGSLGGLLSFREETLDQVQNQLGQLAVSLALAFNAQHEQGIDLNGNPGQPVFSISEPIVFANSRNTGTANVSGVFSDISELKGFDYTLKFDAAADEFEVRVNGSKTVFRVPVDTASGEFIVDGVTLTVDDLSKLSDGDRFELQPTRRSATSIQSLITDPAELAGGLEAASGDNRNALALLDLQTSRIVGGNATLSQTYARIVSTVGNRSNVVQVNLQAQKSLTEQLEMVQQSESGVNLDEEAANLIRFQQFYQANAQVIQTGATILDTILGLRA